MESNIEVLVSELKCSNLLLQNEVFEYLSSKNSDFIIKFIQEMKLNKKKIILLKDYKKYYDKIALKKYK